MAPAPIHRPIVAALACILAAATARAQAPADLKPYTQDIPGTSLKFNLVPIPGGTYKMGSPDARAKRGEDEGPVHEVKIAPFWMGTHEVTWDEYEQFGLSIDFKRKQRENVNLAGQPAISVPNGFGPNNLPTGIQFTGRAWSEARLLTIAHAYQQATDWHRRRPPAVK